MYLNITDLFHLQNEFQIKYFIGSKNELVNLKPGTQLGPHFSQL